MRLLAPAAALSLLLLGAPAAAATDVACWNRDVERLDYHVNPPEGGDNQFFTAVTTRSDNTNVTLLYPAKSTMREFIRRMRRMHADGSGIDGCSNVYLNNLTYFMPSDVPAPAGPASLQGPYSSSKTYPDPGPMYAGGGGQSDGLAAGAVYRYLNWPANDASGVAEDAWNACGVLSPLSDDRRKICYNCLQTKGYWLNNTWRSTDPPAQAGIFTTNWLRFHPTKWTLMSLAYKRLINGPLLSQLREGVIATNGDTGGKVIQKMLPQDCGGTGRPLEQKQKAIDTLSYTSSANPLAELLFNAAWFLGGQQNPWHFSNSNTRPGTAMQLGKSGPCTNCTGDFVVLFSDRRGDAANPTCVRDLLGQLPAHCSEESRCNELGLGTEDDGDDFLRPSYFGGTDSSPFSFTGFPGGTPQTPAGTCQMDFADDIARWMHTNPVAVGNSASKITTYVVALGDKDSPNHELTSLMEIAKASDTTPIVANNFRDLEKGIEDVMKLIISRATSFSAAAITSVQTRGYTSAFIPRFRPDDGAQWAGSLSRYQLFNEFADGCSQSDFGKVTDRNPNGNSSCDDIYLRDVNKNFVGESPNGDFVLLDNSKPWSSTSGWPLKTNADGSYLPATPVWEAATKLAERADKVIAGDTTQRRKIYTVAPDGTTGRYATGTVEFKVENAATLAPLLQLGGVDGTLCKTLSGFTRNTYSTEADCARDVIRFVHGEDVLRQNPYNRTFPQPSVYKSRPGVLGDIFHSTPVLVTPPVLSEALCKTGIINQCLPTVFATHLTAGGADPYLAYAKQYEHREQFVLVAANDGMLHAFNSGVYQESTTAGIPSGYDLGTGEELWAFIPPETLPKLIRYVIGERHELLLDGTAMVRDVWTDGSGNTQADRTRQTDEFHTVAVVGKREGGRAYFALDVTAPRSPRFLWASPLPGTGSDLARGGSWNDLGPAAPPIGPIPEYDVQGFGYGASKARERWVVAVGGGYDPALIRGRSIHMLDVWTGETVYRFAHGDAVDSTDPRKQLFPVAAPVSLVDSNNDYLFDLAVVGDTAGQVWTLNMFDPGRDTDGDQRYDNWLGARAFVQFKGERFGKRSPFFQRAAVAIPDFALGDVRVYLGAGDRDNIKQPNGGTCGLPNLLACVRKNCDVTVTSTQYRIGTGPSGGTSGHKVGGSWSFKKDALEPTSSLTYSTTAQSASCSDVVDASLDFAVTCTDTAKLALSSKAYCDWGVSTPGTECPVDTGRPLYSRVDYTTTVENSRFYAFRLFGENARARFTTADAARSYDAAALTDTSLVDAGTTTAPADGMGWYLKHANSSDERTATAAALLGGCVVWNTLKPNPNTEVACNQTTLPPDTAYLYTASAMNGSATCGPRMTARSTYTAPQQPAPVVSVNSTTGKINYSLMDLPPGSAPISVTVGSTDLVGPVHWLEVPRAVHDCRHGGNCN